jgi:hypothetical protein
MDISSQPIGHTEEMRLEFPGCSSYEQLNQVLDEFNREDEFREIPGPLLRVNLIEQDECHYVVGDVLYPPSEREGKFSAYESVIFGFFEIRRGVLRGFQTITTEWANDFFVSLGEYLRTYGFPDMGNVEIIRNKSGDIVSIESNMTETKIDPDTRKSNRGPNSGTLERCMQAMERWLDKSIGINKSCEFTGVDRKTVYRRIPEVLDKVDIEKREKWISLLHSLGKSRYLGKYTRD